MALEGQTVRAWVWDQLVADNGPGGVNTLCGGTASAPGRIYAADLVPATAPLPAISLTLVADPDSSTIGGVRVFGRVSIDVHVHGDGANYGPVNPIAARVDEVLQNASGTKSGVYLVELRRTDTRATVDVDAGKSFTHVIQTYYTEAHVQS